MKDDLQNWQSYCNSRCSDAEISNTVRVDEVLQRRGGGGRRARVRPKKNVQDSDE